jgi:hypothetical protein
MRESQGKGLKRSKSSFRSSKVRNHPFEVSHEGTPSPQYERNVAQVSQFYISVWPNKNQSASYHEKHVWPWPLCSISVWHQLCEIVGKRRSISRKGIHSWWRSLLIFFQLSAHGCLLLTLAGLEVELRVERLGWLSMESSAESMYHVSSSNTPPRRLTIERGFW